MRAAQQQVTTESRRLADVRRPSQESLSQIYTLHASCVELKRQNQALALQLSGLQAQVLIHLHSA